MTAEKKPNIYSRVKVPLKLLDGAILSGIALLAILIVLLSVYGGYDVNFDTAGGSEIPTQKLRYGDTVTVPEDPVRENYTFGGWYADPECTEEFDFSASVSAPVTVFAYWLS